MSRATRRFRRRLRGVSFSESPAVCTAASLALPSVVLQLGTQRPAALLFVHLHHPHVCGVYRPVQLVLHDLRWVSSKQQPAAISATLASHRKALNSCLALQTTPCARRLHTNSPKSYSYSRTPVSHGTNRHASVPRGTQEGRQQPTMCCLSHLRDQQGRTRFRAAQSRQLGPRRDRTFLHLPSTMAPVAPTAVRSRSPPMIRVARLL
jgi:hypothetical protein